jgi:dTDP-4-amino-4,6-dideoxygalactose transaminase
MQKSYQYLCVAEGKLETSVKASSDVLSLPLFPELTEDSARSVVRALEEAGRMKAAHDDEQ